VRWGLIDPEGKSAAPPTSADNNTGDTIGIVSPAHSSAYAANPNLPPAIDREAMIAQMGDFDDMAVEMLGMFIEMTEPLLTSLMVARDKKDFHDLQEIAHSLKGGARSACCNVLGDIADKLQQRSEADDFAPELVDDMVAEFDRVKAEVASLKA
ncbi:MAG TPA: Hpt domain-containing protein, partial [Alphaproteobacteria bacterium]|nr:Hpt domain-containing protein [Alphaproteobacteria bacterium]